MKSLLWQYRDVEDLMLQHYDVTELMCNYIWVIYFAAG